MPNRHLEGVSSLDVDVAVASPSPPLPDAKVPAPAVSPSSIREASVQAVAPPVPDAPFALPDVEGMKTVNDRLTREWENARGEILAEQFGSSSRMPEIIAALNDRNAAYLAKKNRLIHDRKSGDTVVSPKIFEGLARLNQEYRKDVASMIGETTLMRLEDERQRIESRYTVNAYTSPSDLF